MAAPNLLLTNAVYGKTARAAVATTSTVLLSNPASSGKVLRVISVLFANVDAAGRTVTLNHHDAAAGGGTALAMVSGKSISANDTFAPVSRNNPIYLEENTSLAALAGTTATINAVVAYEEVA